MKWFSIYISHLLDSMGCFPHTCMSLSASLVCGYPRLCSDILYRPDGCTHHSYGSFSLPGAIIHSISYLRPYDTQLLSVLESLGCESRGGEFCSTRHTCNGFVLKWVRKRFRGWCTEHNYRAEPAARRGSTARILHHFASLFVGFTLGNVDLVGLQP